jgi:hypothetical protein
MHGYLHLIHERGQECYSDLEQQQLRDCLTSAPGVQAIKDLKRDPRGGYSVTLEWTGDDADSIHTHITSHGYRAVI